MQTDHVTQKKRLRAQLNARGGDSGVERRKMDEQITDRFLSAFQPDPTKSLSFFWPMAKECDTRDIANQCHAAGMACALPIIRSDVHGLKFLRWEPDAGMIKSSFGTMEPRSDAPEVIPDIMLIPLVMVDEYGTRLGRGAGHYDATIARMRALSPAFLTIGIAYDWQVSEDALPVEDHDQRLDGLVTPSRFILFP